MRTISIKDLDHSDISKVVRFTIPDPVLSGYTSPSAPKITITGILVSYVRRNLSNALVLEVGNSKYSINEVWQEALEISFPAESV